MTIIQVGDVRLQRFPASGTASTENCFQQCEDAGLVVVPADYLAQLRIAHPEKNSPAWKVNGCTRSIVITGKNQIAVVHGYHPLMTAKAIREFQLDSNRFVTNGIILTNHEVEGIVAHYRDNREERRDVWYIGSNTLAKAKFDPVYRNSVNINDTRGSLLAPFIGSKSRFDKWLYLSGFRNNPQYPENNSKIGVFVDEDNVLKGDLFLARPLWLGSDYTSDHFVDLNGYKGTGSHVWGIQQSVIETRFIEDLL